MAAYWRKFFAAMVALMSLTPATSASAEEDAIEHGEYLVRAGGCISCHTATGGQPFAGGRALATPFGTFYTPILHRIPRPVLGAGPMHNSCGRCARACGPTGPIISRYSRIRASLASATAMRWQ